MALPIPCTLCFKALNPSLVQLHYPIFVPFMYYIHISSTNHLYMKKNVSLTVISKVGYLIYTERCKWHFRVILLLVYVLHCNACILIIWITLMTKCNNCVTLNILAITFSVSLYYLINFGIINVLFEHIFAAKLIST